MVTKEQAMAATWWHGNFYTRGNNGKICKVRVNGACKTWKTRPNEFRLPVKYGLRECLYIDHDNAHCFFTSEAELHASEKV